MIQALDLIIDVTDPAKQGLKRSFSSSQPIQFPSEFRFDGVAQRIRAVRPSASSSRPWDDIDLSTATVTCSIDVADTLPTSGSFKVSDGTNYSALLPFDVSATDLASAINALGLFVAAPATVGVVKNGNDYIVTRSDNGTLPGLSAVSASLFPPSSVPVVQIQAGASGVGGSPAILVLSIIRLAAASVVGGTPLPVAAASVTTIRNGGSGVKEIQRITLDPIPYDGTFTITTAAGQTGSIACNAVASDVAAALNAVTASRWSVVGNAGGPWDITENSGTDIALLTVDVTGLVVPIGLSQVLALNTPGMEARFAQTTDNSITLTYQISVQFPFEEPETILSIPMVVNRSVIRTGSVTIPSVPLAYTIAQSLAAFVQNRFSITGLTGGGSTNLDGIATAGGAASAGWIVRVNNSQGEWLLVAGTHASNPAGGFVLPADYNATTNQLYWKEIG